MQWWKTVWCLTQKVKIELSYDPTISLLGGKNQKLGLKETPVANVPACAQLLSFVQLFVTPWTVAHQTPLSMGFSRQEYWSGLLCLPPGNIPDPGIVNSRLRHWQADSFPQSHLLVLLSRFSCVRLCAAP